MNRTSAQFFAGSRAMEMSLISRLIWPLWVILLALFLTLFSGYAQDRDDRYLQVFDLIQQGDSLSVSNKPAAALPKYQQAYAALQTFQRDYPEWNSKVVSFRLKYLAEKIAELSAGPGTAQTGGNAANGAASASGKSASGNNAAAAQVKLLEPGAEPRQALRLHPKVADKQTLTLTMKTSMETKAGEMQMPAMKLPEVKMVIEVSVNNVTPDGDIAYGLAVSDVNVADDPGGSPQVTEAMKSAVSSMKGMSGTGTLSSRGLSKETDIKVASSADAKTRQAADQLKDSFSHFATVFPEEPVGQGARWEVKMPVKSQGLSMTQTATYKLDSVENDHVKISTTITQAAANQKIDSPAMPGMKVDVIKMTGKGTANSEEDLAHIIATEASLNLQAEMSMAINMGAQKQPMTMKTEQEIHLQGK